MIIHTQVQHKDGYWHYVAYSDEDSDRMYYPHCDPEVCRHATAAEAAACPIAKPKVDREFGRDKASLEEQARHHRAEARRLQAEAKDAS